ncbi:ABC transporter ATP-binding protein [Viridibacillus sp. FSL R5-0888]|uniref:ABC transporter ATP-binding protein n=1 Tax=Viridibacillus sp. FSL R5-0888 TaxID=2921663 RepID=UPI0030F58ACB
MKRLFVNYVRPLWKPIIIGLALSLVSTLLMVSQPLVMKNLINTLTGGQTTSFIRNVTLLISIPILATVISYIQTYFLSGIGQKISQKLREDTFQSMLNQPTEYLDKNSAGSMYQNVQDSIIVGDGYIDYELVPAILSVFTLLLTFGSMLLLDIPISLIILAFSLLTVFLTAMTGTKVKEVESKYRGARIGSADFLQEVLANVRTVRLFTNRDREIANWKKWLEIDRGFWMKRRLISDLNVNGILIFIQSLCLSIVIIYGYIRVQNDLLSLGSIVAFIAYVPMVFQSVSSLQRAQLGTKKVKIVLNQIYTLLDSQSEHPKNKGKNMEDKALEIEFKKVDFHYPDRQEGLIDINFTAKQNSTTLIVGPSGVGKSTIIDLLTCLYYPNKGEVSIAGIPTVDWNKDELRKQIGIVPQNVVIWNRTLRENLLYGISNAHQISSERIDEVIRITRLESFVKKLPDGLEEVLGPNAVQASGGERQRIALARALLRNPAILIFDEVTSALDPILSAEITELIWSKELVSTKIIVSHRLSFASRVDQILVVDTDGTITCGKHNDLKNNHSLYSQLVMADEFQDIQEIERHGFSK